jgi:hypothetical protein
MKNPKQGQPWPCFFVVPCKRLTQLAKTESSQEFQKVVDLICISCVGSRGEEDFRCRGQGDARRAWSSCSILANRRRLRRNSRCPGDTSGRTGRVSEECLAGLTALHAERIPREEEHPGNAYLVPGQTRFPKKPSLPPFSFYLKKQADNDPD